MKRGELYRVAHPSARDPKKSRVFVIVSRQVLIDSKFSKGMRQLNGVYTQASNRRHDRSGHLFQGRYKAILVDGDAYLLELTRYVVLNPVRADMVELPGDWRWSSYLDMLGARTVPHWLAIDGLLAQFADDRQEAVRCLSGLETKPLLGYTGYRIAQDTEDTG